MKGNSNIEYYPYVAEKWAIDSLNAIAAAEVGVRALRNKGLFDKVLDFFTGDDVELQAQIDADIITSQKAILNIVRELIFENTRTKYSLVRVVDTLASVINKLNEHSARIQELDSRLSNVEKSLEEISFVVVEMNNTLRDKIAHIDFMQRRSDELRRLTAHFQAGLLHGNLGSIMCSALYIAQVSNLFAFDSEQTKEVEYAKSVVLTKLSKETSTIEDVLLSDVNNVNFKSYEIIGYVTSQNQKPLCLIINRVAERALVHLANTKDNIREQISVASLYDESYFLKLNSLSSPYNVAVQLASELAGI